MFKQIWAIFGKICDKHKVNINNTQWALYPSTRESRKEKVGKGYKQAISLKN